MIGAVIASALMALVMWLGASALSNATPARPAPERLLEEAQPESPDDAITAGLPGDPSGKPQRLVYRYSVVPGGTYTADEVRRAVSTDRVVAAHYSNLDQTRLHIETVSRDRYVHVSYRQGNEIFWTQKKVLLRKGETILTDGTTRIRARCGNCISEEPLWPTAAKEPDVVEFDRLTDTVVPRTTTPATAAAPATTDSPPWDAALAGQSAPAQAPTPGRAAALLGGGPIAPMSSGGAAGSDVPLVQSTRSGVREPGPNSPETEQPAPGNGPTPPPALPEPGSGSPGPGTEFPPPGGMPLPPGDGNGGTSFDGPIPPWPGGPDDEDLESFQEYPPEQPPSGNGPANPVPAPEPGTLLLVGGGAATLLRQLRARSQ